MNAIELGANILVAGSPALLAALSWLSVRGAQLINAHVGNLYLRGVLLRLDNAVFAAVKEVQLVTVDAIKSSAKDGKLTADERIQVKQTAVGAVKSHLGAEGLAELAKILGLDADAVDRFVSSHVEAAVHDLRNARVPAPAAATAGRVALAA
jgi:hypothetical protein